MAGHDHKHHPLLAALMGQRRKDGARWSATFSTKRRIGTAKAAAYPAGTSATDTELRKDLWGASQFSLHWRYDGVSSSKSFALPDGIDDALEFRRTLVIAIADDWDADDRRRPVRPGTPAAAHEPTAADSNVLAFRAPPTGDRTQEATPGTMSPIGLGATDRSAPAVDPLTGLPRPVAGAFAHLRREVIPIVDFAQLVAWRMNELETTTSTRHLPRSPNTLGSYDSELAIAERFFRYLPGDARLAHDDIEPHSPMRFDLVSDLNIAEADCVAFVTYRKEVNFTTRAQNRVALRNWGRAIEKAERAVAHRGAPVELPAAPTPTVEAAGPSTVRSGTRSVKAAISDAHAEGLVAFSPWTPYVDKLIERPAATHYTDKRLYSAEQVAALAEAMAAHTRASTKAGGDAHVIDGGRYRGLIELAYAAMVRPEESIALRLSHTHLTGDEPHLEIDEAEVNQPLRFSGLSEARAVVALKHRGQGDSRIVPLTTQEAAALQRHIDTYVPDPDPMSPDRDRHDPRLFTTHTGAPLDLGRFSEDWMIPVLDKVFAAPRDAHLRALRFRHLRHAGITRRLLDSQSCEAVARLAGNSPLVIMTSYRGVIDQVDPAMRTDDVTPVTSGGTVAALAAELTNLDADAAVAHIATALPDLTAPAAIAVGRALVHSGRSRLDQEDI